MARAEGDVLPYVPHLADWGHDSSDDEFEEEVRQMWKMQTTAHYY
jgi:hypothetical protein